MNKRLVIGLGNVGEQYVNTRHNIGFMILDRFIQTYSHLESQRNKNKSLQSVIVNHSNFVMIYPQTYMNLSGVAVKASIKWYNTNISDIVVIHDDLSLETGRIKWVNSGGSAGQKGVASIINAIGTNDFIRIKVGIGPDIGGDRRSEFVLSRFRKEELESLEKSVKASISSLYAYLCDGTSLEQIMNEYNIK